MVEISYGEHYELVDLAGKSVAEVREQYKSGLEIPDRAKANLNGKQLKKKLEPETKLGNEDKLSFEEKGRRGLVLLGASLLALAITGGLFAYTYTSTTATIDAASGAADFATVSENTSGTSGMQYTVLGSYTGQIPAGHVFNVMADDQYPGDLEVTVFLSNADEMIENYRFWMMRLELVNSANVSLSKANIIRPLTLSNVQVSFASDNFTAGTPFYVRSLGGVYRAFPWSLVGTVHDPQLFCEISQVSP